MKYDTKILLTTMHNKMITITVEIILDDNNNNS